MAFGANHLQQLAEALVFGAQATNNSVQQLAGVVADAEHRRGLNQGYRALKPKRDITCITGEGAKSLMLEQVRFTIDLGELGINVKSEAAYRQLRAVRMGHARDTVELTLSHPTG